MAATIDEKVQQQARGFITRADLLLFVVDNKDGLLPQDKQLAMSVKKLLPSTKQVVLVANKVDSQREASAASQFWRLDLGEPQTVSAASGAGSGDLLDLIVKKLAALKKNPTSDIRHPTSDNSQKEALIRVCILGKPNVGKSSLLNAILGYERVIVSPLPHTTREPQDTDFNYQGRVIKLIDTAGINKKWRDTQGLEKMGISKSLRILKEADVALLVVDSFAGLSKQEAKLAEEILEQRKSLIIVGNKWDLVETRDTEEYNRQIYRQIPFAGFAPIIFLSAAKRTKLDHLLDLILRVAANRHLVVDAAELEAFAKRCVAKHPPTKGKGSRLPRLYSFQQSDSNPPEFAVRIGAKENLAESYLNFLTNQLRARYDLIGTPIKLWVAKTKFAS